MPYYNRDPKGDHTFDNHPYIYICERRISLASDAGFHEEGECGRPGAHLLLLSIFTLQGSLHGTQGLLRDIVNLQGFEEGGLFWGSL